MSRSSHLREVSGILLLDKPQGYSSNQALQRVKRLFGSKKAGHAGTLDPLATGMLVVALGGATRSLSRFLQADKTYWVTAKLGVQTSTGDAEGEVLKTNQVPFFSEETIQHALRSFIGEIMQVPPMYSALKHKGVALYTLARRGLTVERAPRAVVVYGIECLEFKSPFLSLSVRCGKGTYIRTLIEDIGASLGCGAHVSALRRTKVGSFSPEHMFTLETLEKMVEAGRHLEAFLPQPG